MNLVMFGTTWRISNFVPEELTSLTPYLLNKYVNWVYCVKFQISINWKHIICILIITIIIQFFNCFILLIPEEFILGCCSVLRHSHFVSLYHKYYLTLINSSMNLSLDSLCVKYFLPVYSIFFIFSLF